jgi:predicted dehydrogenase
MNFAIIGLGEYAEEQHVPAFSKKGKIVAVADFRTKSGLCTKLCPDATFIPVDNRTPQLVASCIAKHLPDACIVSTPPEVHKEYILALLQLRIPVFADKPLTFPPNATTNIQASRRLWQDYEDILECSEKNSTSVWIHTQHRHDLILGIIRKESEKAGTQIHFLDISKTDGQQRLPQEMNFKQHHGYVGEGIIAHSTYHYVDFAMQLLNQLIIDEVIVDTTSMRASDVSALLYAADTEATGEVDAYVTLQARLKDKLVCSVRLSQQHTGVSARDTKTTPTNWSRNSGRVKQQRISAHLGHAVTIVFNRVFSPKLIGMSEHVGTICEIFRNPAFCHEVHETIVLADRKGKLKTNPRDKDVEEFIRFLQGGNVSTNLLCTHERSIKVYSAICESLARAYNKLPSKVAVYVSPIRKGELCAKPLTKQSTGD